MKVSTLFSNFLDDTKKKKSALNRNYFYITTIFFIALNLCIWALAGTKLHYGCLPKNELDWDNFLDFQALFSAIINNISHWSWEHVLLNMLVSSLVVSLYLERRFGSLKYFLIVTVLIVVSAAFVAGNNQSLNYAGFSCVNFALYAFFIVTFFFSLSKRERSKGNVIFGVVILMGVLVFMIWEIWDAVEIYGATASASDLFYNKGHYSGFIAGLIVVLVLQITKVFTIKEYSLNEQTSQIEENTKNLKILYIIFACLASALILSTLIICLVS